MHDEDVRDAALRRRDARRRAAAGAFLQLARVYGQALAQIADAEVRLVHLYVHEPLMRDGVPSVEIARGDGGDGPRADPVRRCRCIELPPRPPARHFVEQDMIGHMEAELGDGRARGRPPAGGDRVRRPGRLRAADRGARRRGGGRHGRALRRGGRAEPARRRARDQDARGRGDGRRLRPGRARPSWAVRLQSGIAPGDPPRGSGSTTARRSTATATTTDARSTRRPAWWRGPAGARCSSRGRWWTGGGRGRARVRSHRRGAA